MFRFLISVIFLGGMSPFFWPMAHAQIAGWLSPGELSSPHQSLSNISQCTQCHATAKGVPDIKCLDCHTEISQRVARAQGYHARQEKSCRNCHREHQGKKYDLMGLSRLRFDHNETGWRLGGAHLKVDCRKCHTETRTDVISGKKTSRPSYLGAPSHCEGCHKDVHRAAKTLFKKCENCHSTSAFVPTRTAMKFDHNRQTAYPLTGKHQEIKCKSCHTKNKWAPIAFANCTDCHKDPHRGKFGKLCVQCHSTASWKKSRRDLQGKSKGFGTFDHQKTAFPLLGKHQNVSCDRCHGEKIGKIASFSSCQDCHNSPHDGQFQRLWKKKDCQDCHTNDGWQVLNFQHNQDSRYTLRDQHQNVPCDQCHVDQKYRWLSQSPDCQTCHQDVHRGQFKAQKCSSCHNLERFDQVNFDHNTRTRFPLEGRHLYAQCQSCHQNGKYRGISTSCVSCHQDVHRGTLGRDCKKCHTPQSFQQIRFDHNRDSNFPLTGQHQKVACESCHPNKQYKIGLKTCNDCHQDVHQGAFGGQCQQCHSTASFKDTQDYHDFGEFRLGGIHTMLACQNCHDREKPLRIDQPQCSSCHADPHFLSFGKQCQDCHNQQSFLPSTFRHRETGFELSGAHRFVSCDSCHVNRVFGGLPSECQFCHAQQFQAAQFVPAHQSGVTDCMACHRTFGWRPAR